MAGLESNLNANSLSVVNVSGVDKAIYQKTKFGFAASKTNGVSGYKVVASYSGNAVNYFGRQKNVKHGARIMGAVYDSQRNTTDVTYFFDNHDSLNTEDAYYMASMFQSILAAKVIKTK